MLLIKSLHKYIAVQVGSPVKIMPGTPGKSAGNGTEIRQDIVRFYKDSGLEPVAKEVMCVCVCVCALASPITSPKITTAIPSFLLC